jgi:VWFA-related protein
MSPRATHRAVTALAACLLVLGRSNQAAPRFALTQDPAPTFRARADFVGIDVSVRRGGRPVTGLTAADFAVFDNGVAQEIAEVSYEKLPIDVTVALDVSASVTGAILDQLRQAVLQLKRDLGAQDRLKVIAFNMRVALVADVAPAAAHDDRELDDLRGMGSSSIFDALAVALATPVPADRRQMIVLFSDGQDSSSITSPATLLDVAQRTTPTIHVVLAQPEPRGLGRPLISAREVAVQHVFNRLASDTGGTLIPISRDGSLASTFRRSLDEFRASYVLHFAPRGVARSGAHTLTVRVNRPGMFEVRARSGYVWR